MNDAWTILIRSVGVVGITLVAYGLTISIGRMPLLAAAVAAAVAGVGLAWAFVVE